MQTDPLPNTTTATPSPLQPIYEYRFSIPDGQSLVKPVVFSVSDAEIQGNDSQINTLQINDVPFKVDKPAMWNSNSTTYTYQLFFELWIYNVHTGSVEFNNRYTGLQLNLTQTPAKHQQ